MKLRSEYDAAGNRTDLKALINGTADFWNEYFYDDLNRMTSVQQHGAAGGAAVAEKRIDFAYDAAGQWDTITRYADLSATQLVATSTYTFDDANRLIALTHAKGANTLADYSWTYGAADRVITFTNALYSSEDATYSYDDTNQLTGADRAGTSNDESYSYDANGNLTNTGYTTGTNNQLTSDGTYNYEYDNEGNRITRTEIATGIVDEYAWDHHNRLVNITTKSSATGPATTVVDYVYDLWGRRIAKLLDEDADSTYDTEEYFIHDGERYERGNAGDHIALVFDGDGELKERNLFGPAVDQILATERIDEVFGTTAPGETLWPLPDNLGTIRDIAEYDSATDATTIANHLTIDSFGNITAETAPTLAYRYAFTARERDPESNLHHYRARYYLASTGVFLSQDPIHADFNNLYRYVGNKPTIATDPSGLDFVLIYTGIHMGIEIDLWDENGNHIGVLSVDFGAYGWRNNDSSISWSSDESSGLSSSLCNSHRSWSFWRGRFNSGQFIIGLKKGGKLPKPDGDNVLKQKGSIEADKKMLEYIAKSVGMTSEQLIKALEGGKTSFMGRGRWYSYEVFFNNCRSFANWTWYRYADYGGEEIEYTK